MTPLHLDLTHEATRRKLAAELGGKAPLVILDDADLDEAVAAAAFGAFMHQGQICMSTERIIVVEAVDDPYGFASARELSMETIRACANGMRRSWRTLSNSVRR